MGFWTSPQCQRPGYPEFRQGEDLVLGVPNTGASGMVYLPDREGQRWKGEGEPRKEPSWQEDMGRESSPSCDSHFLGTSPVHGGATGVQKNKIFPVCKNTYILVQEMGPGQDFKRQD